MKHLLTVLEIKHLDTSGKVLWEGRDFPNLLHLQGESYCLSALFSTLITSIPTNYYAGLDNRSSPAASDTLANLSQEPSQGGYARQAVSSGSGFVVALNNNGIYQATSGVLTFVATGSWGPVQNIFLATTLDNSGLLLSTAALDGLHTLSAGEQLTLRIGLSLNDAGVSVSS